MTRLARLPLAAAAAVILCTSAHAQPAPRSGGPQQPDLPALLHLRPDQMGAFHALEAASQPHPDEISQMRAASPQTLADLPTPVRLQRINTFLTVQLQVFHRRADATRAFYGQLSPDQQKSFDQLSARGPGGGPGPSGR